MNRTTWSAERPGCWLCPGEANDTHEIARGPAKQAAMKEPAAWVRTCRRDHDDLDDYSLWPIARQLALKWLMDPENYNRRAVNVLRGRQPNAITHAEVMGQVPHVVLLLVENGVPLWRIEELLDARDQ